MRPDGKLRPSGFRLQISTVRERHGKVEEVPEGKWNGVAESTAGNLAERAIGEVRFALVDDPIGANGHALVAAVLPPGVSAPQDFKAAVRNEAAKAFRVVRPPT